MDSHVIQDFSLFWYDVEKFTIQLCIVAISLPQDLAETFGFGIFLAQFKIRRQLRFGHARKCFCEVNTNHVICAQNAKEVFVGGGAAERQFHDGESLGVGNEIVNN